MTIYEKLRRMPVKELAEHFVYDATEEDLDEDIDGEWMSYVRHGYLTPVGFFSWKEFAIEKTIEWLNSDERNL